MIAILVVRVHFELVDLFLYSDEISPAKILHATVDCSQACNQGGDAKNIHEQRVPYVLQKTRYQVFREYSGNAADIDIPYYGGKNERLIRGMYFAVEPAPLINCVAPYSVCQSILSLKTRFPLIYTWMLKCGALSNSISKNQIKNILG